MFDPRFYGGHYGLPNLSPRAFPEGELFSYAALGAVGKVTAALGALGGLYGSFTGNTDLALGGGLVMLAGTELWSGTTSIDALLDQ